MMRALAICVLMALVATAHATDVPATVSFTARLVDDKTTQPIIGTHAIVFDLFDAETAGHSMWTENDSITSDDGLVFVDLGETTAIDPKMFDGRQFWLQVTLDGTVMDPRIALDSVPYSIRSSNANNADAVGGMPASSFQQKITGTCATGNYMSAVNADGTVACTPANASPGTISGVTAGPGLMGGGTSGNVTLSVIPCSMGDVLKWSGAGWSCGTDANSGGTITAVTIGAAGGLMGGGTAGSVALSLPTVCAGGQMLKWNGATWGCANDIDTNSGGTITGVTVGAAGGLMGGGTTGSVALSLPNTCGAAQLLKWSGTTWACANDIDTNSGGTITDVTAGTGLTGGGATGAVTLAVGQGIGIVVQTDTVGLDTAYTDARYLMQTGGTMTGAINMGGNLVTNRGCPASYTQVGPGLCVQAHDACCYTFTGAANVCRIAGTHLCTSAEMRAAMASGVTLADPVTQDWLADQSTTGNAFWVADGTSSEAPDGTRATTTASWARCCASIE